MAKISDVPGINGSILALFEGAGFESAEALAERSAREVVQALAAANRRNGTPVRLPDEGAVAAWQIAARGLVRRERLEALPAAREVRHSDLQAAGIDVNAVPVARVVGDRPVRRERAPVPNEASIAKERGRAAPPVETAAVPKAARPAAPKEHPVATRGAAEGVPTKGRPKEKKFRQLEVVQKEAKPSERRNRGMSHPDAGRVRLAAAVTVMGLLLGTLTTLALGGALVMARFHDWEFHWSIALLLLVYPLCISLYLGIGAKVRCRLCGQRLFVPRHCLKHERASRSIFGHTFAVARNAMIFGSYRCMLCGTKTRLKD